jgi:5'-deoxynucleotidase YfbR-like HD superfamily hydrolase
LDDSLPADNLDKLDVYKSEKGEKDKEERILDLFGVISVLNKLERFQQKDRNHPETVSQHCFQVATLSLILSHHVDNVDPMTAFHYGHIHDIPEGITGDIPKETKYYNPELFDEMEKFVLDSLQEAFDDIINPDMLDIDRRTREWSFVKEIDTLQCLFYLKSEIETGNSTVSGIFDKIKSNLVDSSFEIIAKIAERIEPEKDYIESSKINEHDQKIEEILDHIDKCDKE